MPFCPHCGYEYNPGVTHCSDCGLPLVPHPVNRENTPARRSAETLPVVVYVAQGLLPANVVKSRLESEGIPAILQYESASLVYGLTVDGLGQVRVLVPEPLVAAARAVIAAALAAGSLQDDADDESNDEDGPETEDGDTEDDL